MRFVGVVLVTCLINFAKIAYSAAVLQCNPILEISWLFDPKTTEADYRESEDNRSRVSLYIDKGFVKFTDPQKNESLLFRQNSIVKNTENPFDISARYENSGKLELSKTSVILTDPMCQSSDYSHVTIFRTLEFGYKNSVYNCECLSSIRDGNNFIHQK
jgi:hypothetical protein